VPPNQAPLKAFIAGAVIDGLRISYPATTAEPSL